LTIKLNAFCFKVLSYANNPIVKFFLASNLNFWNSNLVNAFCCSFNKNASFCVLRLWLSNTSSIVYGDLVGVSNLLGVFFCRCTNLKISQYGRLSTWSIANHPSVNCGLRVGGYLIGKSTTFIWHRAKIKRSGRFKNSQIFFSKSHRIGILLSLTKRLPCLSVT